MWSDISLDEVDIVRLYNLIVSILKDFSSWSIF